MNALLFCVVTAATVGPAAGAVRIGMAGVQGGPGLTGVSGDDTVRPPFKLAWTYRLDGDASSDAGPGGGAS
jgi:hypothetical protein